MLFIDGNFTQMRILIVILMAITFFITPNLGSGTRCSPETPNEPLQANLA